LKYEDWIRYEEARRNKRARITRQPDSVEREALMAELRHEMEALREQVKIDLLISLQDQVDRKATLIASQNDNSFPVD
jgi:hypothetical protein